MFVQVILVENLAGMMSMLNFDSLDDFFGLVAAQEEGPFSTRLCYRYAGD